MFSKLFSKKSKTVVCSSRLLFDILADDLNDGLCTDIFFTVEGHKHRFGAWGDNGETKKNVIFYLDKSEYDSLENLKAEGTINGANFYDANMSVIVTECNGCYPESTPRLLALMTQTTHL
ncbi:hypothetical protein SAMN05216349_10364 [Oribacterium sp. KHPX15]|uniref:hypothetical protein n=1 Tax=Oribacterium sp. KHPX15 TaxID=1855342 RepID=UPI000899DFA8|nr:hypothetical protein [Oribacterium sp. KHPX15]SDZ96936.1 hypothetical protein SAMN05216349_10364 [Oribacterium sp. KHPX15]